MCAYVIDGLIMAEHWCTVGEVAVEVSAVALKPYDADGARSYNRPELVYLFDVRVVEACLCSGEDFFPRDGVGSVVSPRVRQLVPRRLCELTLPEYVSRGF